MRRKRRSLRLTGAILVSLSRRKTKEKLGETLMSLKLKITLVILTLIRRRSSLKTQNLAW
jgi:hypothetical protein